MCDVFFVDIGPYVVKKAVENKPVILGKRVTHRYFRGKNYFEIDCHADDSIISAGILKVCHRFSKQIVVDMSWVIQGESEEELPEKVLLGVSIHHLDFNNTDRLDVSLHPQSYINQTEESRLSISELNVQSQSQSQLESQQSPKQKSKQSPKKPKENVQTENEPSFFQSMFSFSSQSKLKKPNSQSSKTSDS